VNRLLVPLAAVLLVVAAGLLVRAGNAVREARDLKPRPDALEYGLGAASLADNGTYALHIGDAEYPPRYPFGFSLLLTPFVAGAGGDPAAAWLGSFAYGLLAILLTIGIGWRMAGPLGGVIGGAIVACSPEAVRASTLLMSESASMALLALAVFGALLAVRGAGRESPVSGWLLVAGASIGLAVTVRYTNLALLLPVALFFGTRHALAPEATSAKLRSVTLLALPALLGLAAVLAYNAVTFGALSHDGYRFWQPDIYANPDHVFSARYLLKGIPGYWDEGHLRVYGSAIAGVDGRLFTPFVSVLAVLGIGRAFSLNRTCPAARLMLLIVFTSVPILWLFHLGYFWQDPRFLLPVLPVIAAFAGSGIVWLRDLLGRLLGSEKRAIATAISLTAGLLAATHVGWSVIRGALSDESVTAKRPPPALIDELAALDGAVPRPATLIVNFPVTLAIPALGLDRSIIVADRSTSDPHLNQIALSNLVARNGKTPGVRSLARGERVDVDTVESVLAEIRAGRPVFYLECVGEGQAGAGIDALRRASTFTESFIRRPVTVYQLTR